jgi:alkylresorcinol/alkylpyrone synthase
MPSLAAISTINFPFKVSQQAVKECARDLFAPSFPQVERLLSAFDNTEIITRNFCKPLDYYADEHSFQEMNAEYIRISLEYSVKAIEACIAQAQIDKESITDIIFVSTTGLSTPSLDALIINQMQLNQNINRTPIFGLGCAGGVGGFLKKRAYTPSINKKAEPTIKMAFSCAIMDANNAAKELQINTKVISLAEIPAINA